MIFDALGFSWRRDAVAAAAALSVERATFRFKQSLAQFVFDASALEGNPFTFAEVQTLLDGVTVGGRRVSDEQQVLNLASAAKELLELVRSGRFRMDKATSDRLHARVAREEALEWGHFRGEGQEGRYTPDVHLGDRGRHTPLPTRPGAEDLGRTFEGGVAALAREAPSPLERGLAYFLFGALQQFYFDGNKRTARFMMNGILMSHGCDAISVPATRAAEFNERMVRFFIDRDGTAMMGFLAECQPRDGPDPRPGPSLGPST